MTRIGRTFNFVRTISSNLIALHQFQVLREKKRIVSLHECKKVLSVPSVQKISPGRKLRWRVRIATEEATHTNVRASVNFQPESNESKHFYIESNESIKVTLTQNFSGLRFELKVEERKFFFSTDSRLIFNSRIWLQNKMKKNHMWRSSVISWWP